MTRSQRPGGTDQRRTRIALATITGLLAGASRAVADWLISHFSA